MSIERALIARAQPQIVAANLRELIRHEISKGCRPEISPLPVALEPFFQPIWTLKDNPSSQAHAHWVEEAPPPVENLLRLHVWISPEQPFDWIRCELFLKQLQATSCRIGFEVVGNNKGVTISLLCHKIDNPIIRAAFQGEFELCELTIMDEGTPKWSAMAGWQDVLFRDFFPPPPYSHLLTRPAELHFSPLIPLVTAMGQIEDPAVGLYQTLFQAVHPAHNWHRNVEILLDLEYTIKLQDGGLQASKRYAQQAPSGDLRQMAWEVESKANNDKPLFAMAFRVGVIGAGSEGESLLNSLGTFSGLFQHGGRPLGYITEKEYAAALSRNQIRGMFVRGLTYRSGFLVNSLELTGPVHLPPMKTNEVRPIPVEALETLPVRNRALLSGTWIGTCSYKGISEKVCIPEDVREKHSHFIGRPGMGKSTTQEHMILGDIEQGRGVAVLDPHGDLIERILCLIPEPYVNRTVYFNPADRNWVPIWNPLAPIPEQDIGRTADDIVQAIQSFVSGGGWGDRLEHLLRNMVFSLMHLPNSTFLDLSSLLRNKSEEGKILRREVLGVIDNESVRQFWLQDYERYGKDDLGPPRNKLSKLLVSGTVSLMLSQPESRFNFRQIMDEGLILLINLSNIGSMARGILGCFILSLLHLAALSRSSVPTEHRKQFHIHCDEAHRFMTDSLEDLIAETRKYGVSLSLAHQYMSQFGKRKTDAFSSVGSTVIFNVDSRDAHYLTKDLRKMVRVEDIISLEVGEAIARIGTDIVRVKTRPPSEVPTKHFRSRIIEESRKKYYRPAAEVKNLVLRRWERWGVPYRPLVSISTEGGTMVEEFVYDEFEGPS